MRAYLQVLRRLTGAKAASLFQPSISRAVPNAVLIHDGDTPALPELSTLGEAEAFTDKIEVQLNAASGLRDQALLQQFKSATTGGWLVRVSTPRALPAFSRHAVPAIAELERLRRETDLTKNRLQSSPVVWIGLRREGESLVDFAEETSPEGSKAWWRWVLGLGGTLAWHEREISGILLDSVSGLPGRTQFQVNLGRILDRSASQAKPLVLALINPDDFIVVNEQFGREAGDTVVREIAERLKVTLRNTDFVARYGGAVFSASLPETDRTRGTRVVEKLLPKLSESAYLNGTVRLSFSIGLAVYDPADQDPVESPLELIRRADRALHLAKDLGGGQMVVWEPNPEIERVEGRDRLSGIFTANSAKDYRNMLLLWDTVAIVSASTDFDELVEQVLERLLSTFKPDRAAFFDLGEKDEPRPFKVRSRRRDKVTAQLSLNEAQRAFLSDSKTQGRALQKNLAAGESGAMQCCSIPLVTPESCLGFLYLESSEEGFRIDPADLIFLGALAGQLAVAVDRARLATQEKEREEKERRRLHDKLHELRLTLHQNKLLYCSPQMEKLLGTIRLAAPTDATVLITGETGTGKELLARTVHELSPRKGEPFVVVDCGAISPNLFERELFGHEKGAYTGAQQRAVGFLAEAHGGTLFLDEVGEIPLELQTKLLRFVQEKQFTPVGGTRPRKVDVRLIGATNRDLSGEVEARRFREDLYYRLKVVVLVPPPLRERSGDILYLANHFLQQFTAQYHKDVQCFSAEAEELLLKYPWPGNVRQLQNRIMQAVILCESDQIGTAELGIELEEAAVPGMPNGNGMRAPAVSTEAAVPEPDVATGEAPQPDNETWRALETALDQEIETIKSDGILFPLGRWLEEDLILQAHTAADGVLSRGSELLGIPETTFRRRFRKAQAQAKVGLSPRSPSRERIHTLIADLFREGKTSGQDLLKKARMVLLARVVSYPMSNIAGAAVMGVTEPTYRTWVNNLDNP